MQRRHLLIGALIGLPILLAGGAAAFAASGAATSGSPAQTFLADVASHLGISTGTLESAMQQARLDQVQQLLSAGKITSAQASQMETAIKSGKVGPGFGRREHMGGGMFAGRGAMPAAATYLGLTPQQLRSDLQGGKSLSDIASSQSGKTVAGLEAAITTTMQQEIQQALSAGKITQQQATQQQGKIASFVQQFVTRTGMGAGHGGGWGPPAGEPQPGSSQGTAPSSN